jgi:VanZ family protein
MLPLRYPWFWLAGAWFLVLGVCVGSLLPAAVVPLDQVGGDKLLHAAAYSMLMIWFGGLYRRDRHVAIALALLAFGVSLDLLQGLTETRSFELADIVADAVGVLSGLLLSASLLEGWCQRLERVLGD